MHKYRYRRIDTTFGQVDSIDAHLALWAKTEPQHGWSRKRPSSPARGSTTSSSSISATEPFDPASASTSRNLPIWSSLSADRKRTFRVPDNVDDEIVKTAWDEGELCSKWHGTMSLGIYHDRAWMVYPSAMPAGVARDCHQWIVWTARNCKANEEKKKDKEKKVQKAV